MNCLVWWVGSCSFKDMTYNFHCIFSAFTPIANPTNAKPTWKHLSNWKWSFWFVLMSQHAASIFLDFLSWLTWRCLMKSPITCIALEGLEERRGWDWRSRWCLRCPRKFGTTDSGARPEERIARTPHWLIGKDVACGIMKTWWEKVYTRVCLKLNEIFLVSRRNWGAFDNDDPANRHWPESPHEWVWRQSHLWRKKEECWFRLSGSCETVEANCGPSGNSGDRSTKHFHQKIRLIFF